MNLREGKWMFSEEISTLQREGLLILFDAAGYMRSAGTYSWIHYANIDHQSPLYYQKVGKPEIWVNWSNDIVDPANYEEISYSELVEALKNEINEKIKETQEIS